MPSVNDLKNPKLSMASELYSADGKLIGKYYRENRSSVELASISPYFVKGLVATEDVRFYQHNGIDWKAIASVVWYSIKGDKRGGSTITQQLAKNLFKTRKSNHGLLAYVPILRTAVAKSKEWLVAKRLENNYDKDHILLLYMNTVDFGSNSFGIKAAARTYFDKSPKDLSLSESAVLVGLLKATTTYSPVLHPEKSLERRNVVLSQMRKYQVITDKQYNKALEKPIKLDLHYDNPTDSPVPYIRAAVANQLGEWCSENGYDLYGDGLKIYTTIDMTVQKHAEAAMKQHMNGLQQRFNSHWGSENPWRDTEKQEIPNFLASAIKATPIYKQLVAKFGEGSPEVELELNRPKLMTLFSYQGPKRVEMSSYDSLAYYKKMLRCGFLTLNPTNGEIKSWVGGMDYNTFKLDYVSQTKRQPGSTFKPFVYCTAIEQGLSPCDTRQDKAIRYEYEEDGEDKVWEPRNSNRVFTNSNITLRRAMAQSINSVTAQLTLEVDPKNVVKMAKKLGIESEIKPVPSIGLGTGDVSLIEMLKSYAPFVNGGYSITPILITKIVSRDGKELATFTTKRTQVLDPETAWLMSYMFRGTVDEWGGTSQGLFSWGGIFNNKNHVGGKTGTSNNYSDGWYMGLTSDLIGGVWVGAEDRSVHFKNSATGEALRTALPMFGIFLDKVYRDKNCKIKPSTFPECPEKVEKKHTCWSPAPKVDTLLLDSLAIDTLETLPLDTTLEHKERRRLFGGWRKNKDSTKTER
jgi:penicillin-binding protein 1A